jgi:hypothetical protein
MSAIRDIYGITYNWNPSGVNSEEKYEFDTVGMGTCVKIEEHQAQGEGDKWFYDIYRKDGTILRVFNPHMVYFSEKD